jgi:LysM repeat protein
MKKITESQLKDKVNSLREYLKVYENQQVDEWSVLSPSSWFNGRDYGDSTSRDDVRSQDAAKNSTGGANMALVQNRESLAPGSVASEQGKDGVTYAVDAKGMRTFKIENNKWVAMNPPTPTEQPELMGAPDQGASVTPTAPSTQDLTAAASASGEAVGKSLQRFKELLAKAAAPAAPMAPGEKRTPAEIKASADLGSFAGESTTYFLNKLRLIESRQLNEALTPEEQKELDTLAQSYGDSEDPEIAGLMKQYSDVKNAAMAATPAPAQAAQVTPAAPAKPTGPITWKQIYDLNKDVIGANPNLIKPGQQLKMPDGSTYTVKAGDNLSKIAKNAGGGQGASVTPTAPKPPKAPELTQTQQNLKNYGMYKPGDELRTPTEIAASAGLADATPNPDAGLNVSDPRHSGYAAWKKKQDDLAAAASQNAPDGVNNTVTRQVAGTRGGPNNNGRLGLQPRRQPTAESVGYNELQRIVSLVNHR